MLIVDSHSDVNPQEWNSFICNHSCTPYPQSTYHAAYSIACYSSTPIYVTISLQDAMLRCLLLSDQIKGTVKWSCGPVISGAYYQTPLLIKYFFEWLLSLNLKIKKASFLCENNFNSLFICNQLCHAAQKNKLEISLSTVIKKDLNSDLWHDAIYYSGGKKRKITHIINKLKRDNVELISCSGEAVNLRKEMYNLHYLDAIQQGYKRNEIYNQSAMNAIETIISQDSAGISKSFFTYLDGVLLSCLNIVVLGSECYLRKLALHRHPFYKDPGSSYYAIMSAAEWGQSQGLKTLNLSIARLSSDLKTSQIRQYKSRFGKIILPLYELSEIN